MEWEEHYRIGEAPWDLGEPAPPLVEMLRERPPEIWGEGPILVPGCGRGHDVAALQSTRRAVLGLDLAPTALAEAEKLYGLENGLGWMEGDFLDLKLARSRTVSAIWEHTCFCAIEPAEREAYAAAAAAWLAPGARLVGLFFLDPPIREDEAAGPPYGATIPEIRELFEPYFEFGPAAVPASSHASRADREWLVELIRKR